MTFFYNVPTQVKFKTSADVAGDDEVKWLGGIAYCDEVICGECGGIIECDNIEEIVNLSWVDISNEIMGDEVQE